MDSPNPEILFELLPLIRVHKSGHIERLIGTDFIPPSTDPQTGVVSKDITIVPESDISARLFLPKLTNPTQKLPLVIYFHGGCFCSQSPFTSKYHNYLNTLTHQAQIMAVSVNYRKAPEFPIPTAYEDSWTALQWVASHSNNGGPEAWLNEHADFDRVFLAGLSAGANIAHNLAIVAGDQDIGLGIGLLGIALEHPLFWGQDPIGSEETDMGKKRWLDRVWPFVSPSMPDNDDPRVNPLADGAPSLVRLACRRVWVCVAEKDVLKDRGRVYYEALGRSGWTGVVEIVETEGEDHGFHLNDLGSEKARDLIKQLAEFFNRDMPPLL